MRLQANIGFTMALIGVAGISEAYGSASQTTISALLIIIGGILLYRGLTNENSNTNEHRADNGNVLDRLYFLCK